MKEITFSVDLVNGIMQYLGSRPFVEGAKLIQAIQDEASKQAQEPLVEKLPE